MALPVRFRSQATHDYDDCVAYLDRHASVAVADRFERAVDDSVARLADMPEIGSPWESEKVPFTEIRTWLVKGFENYVIYYRVFAGRIEILHLLHGAQHAEQRLQDLE